jgi:hypothetical protein
MAFGMATVALSVSGIAQVAIPCASHDVVAKSLTTKFKEVRRVLGVVNAKTVMEIFMSPQGTWTVMMTNTSGTTCIIASGENWQEIPVALAGLDS